MDRFDQVLLKKRPKQRSIEEAGKCKTKVNFNRKAKCKTHRYTHSPVSTFIYMNHSTSGWKSSSISFMLRLLETETQKSLFSWRMGLMVCCCKGDNKGGTEVTFLSILENLNSFYHGYHWDTPQSVSLSLEPHEAKSLFDRAAAVKQSRTHRKCNSEIKQEVILTQKPEDKIQTKAQQ